MREKKREKQQKSKREGKGLLPLTNDLVFKAVFGRDTEDCKVLLIAMLNLILERDDEPITDLVYKNPFTSADQPDSKYIVMDIKAQLNTGEWIDIEMQIEHLAAYANRSVFYGAKLVTEQLESGEPYDIIKQVS